MTDYQTGKIGGKGCYFPLRPGCTRATCEKGVPFEEPVLLDPVSASDCKLIAFDSSNGVPVSKYTKEEDEWRYIRAKDSIAFYHLNEGTWNAAREDIMKAVAQLCDRLIQLEESGQSNNDEYDQVINKLYDDYLNPYAEFLSAAQQAMAEKGINL